MSQTTPPREALTKLPIVATVSEAYARVLGNPGLLLRAALAPFGLSLVLIALSFTVSPASPLNVVFALLGFLPYTIFGVAWHRLTLLGPVAGAPPLLPAWTRRHWRFLGYLLAVMLIGYGVTLLVVSVALTMTWPEDDVMPASWGLLLVVGALILAYVMMRLSFVFPAVAVDEDYRLRHAWTHTKGQGLRLLGAAVMAAAPLLVLVWAVSALLGAVLFVEPTAAPAQDALPGDDAMAAFLAENFGAIVLTQAIITAINYVLMAVMVSVISIAFRTCTGWVPALGGPPAGRERGDADA